MSSAKFNSHAFRDPISYMSLFDDTEFNNIGEAYSLYGPGTYFVNLMNLALSDKIVPDADDPEFPLSLLKRRPDLQQLQLNKDNTDRTFPLLRAVVNNALNNLQMYSESVVVPLWAPVAYDNKDWYPISSSDSFIPYDKCISSIDRFMRTFGISLSETLERFYYDGRKADVWPIAVLNLAPFSSTLFVNPPSWPGANAPTPIQFMMMAGLDEEGLMELVYNGLQPGNTKALGTLYINADQPDQPLQYIPSTQKGTPATFQNLTQSRLKQLRTLLILSKSTGWGISATNDVLVALGIKGFNSDNADKALRMLAKLHLVADALNFNMQQFAKSAAGMDAKVFLATVPDSNVAITVTENGLTAKRLANLLSFATIVSDKALTNQAALISYVATKLGISTSLLTTYLKINNIEALTLDTLIHLCDLKKELDNTGSSLSDYILILIESADTGAKLVNFDQWFKQLQETLQATMASYSGTGNQLSELVFKQWIHELSVYWGLNENEVYRFFHGYVTANGDPVYDDLNAVFLKNNGEENAKTFLLAWLPYLLILTRLKFSPEVVEMACAKLYFDIGNIMPQKMLSEDKLFVLLHLQQLFAQILTENRAAFSAMVLDKDFSLPGIIDTMPKISSWTAANIQLLAQSLGYTSSPMAWDSLDLLGKLGQGFAIVSRTTLDLQLLLDTIESLQRDEISAETAQKLEDLLKQAAETDPNMNSLYRQCTQNMLEADRDAVIPWLLQQLNRTFDDIVTPDQLSDYFLMDVSVSGILEVTPLREATDAVQSYLLRCRNGLERVKEDALQKIDKTTWDWVFNFRVWEAEQKLQQYPQNYFQIDNRTDATDLFNEFKNQLQQQDVDEDVAEDAMQFYIDGWLKLTDKVIVDACYYTRASDHKNIVCFLARSNSATQQYFYLEAERTTNGLENYTQWQEVDTRIPANTATIVYAFNRYYIFWSELTSKTDSDPTSVSNKKYTLHTASVKYTTQDVRGNWLAAKDWNSFPFFLETEDPHSGLWNWKQGSNIKSISECLTPDMPCWQKPVAVVIDGSLYVWLSPVVADIASYNVDFGGTPVNDDFSHYMDTIYHHAQGKASILLYPKKLSMNGQIDTYNAHFLYPQAVAESLPLGWINDQNATGVAEAGTFSFQDTYCASVEHFKDAGEMANSFKANLINTLHTGTGESGLTALVWNVLDAVAINGMQAVIFVTDRGTLLLLPEQVAQPFSYTLSYGQNIIINNAVAVTSYQMITLKSLYPQFFNASFRQNGLSNALSFVSQSQPLDFDNDYNYGSYQTADKVKMPSVINSTQAQFEGAYGIYAWEIFFYAPALVAQYLRANLYNEEAGHWYRYILNPFAATSVDAWNFLPFHNPPKSLTTVWSYKKWLAEQYIDNIREWGDNEFRQETWESLNLATQLYFEAEDLLGQAPDVIDRTTTFAKENRTYPDIIKGKLTDFFGWPTDEVLQNHWTTVSDRLYKIRNGLNIDGQPQLPSEYGSPVDPGRLKLALASGGINPFNDSGLTVKNTVYRFRELLPAAESVMDMTIQFGAQLESVLQQHDGEKLQMLQATHEMNMQNFIVQNYQAQIDEAQAEVNAINESLNEAQNQADHYKALIQAGLLDIESDALTNSNSAVTLQVSAAVAKEPATIAHLVPTVFGFSDGCFQPGSAIDSAAGILSESASATQTRAQIQETQANYARRAQEWSFAAASAEMQVTQLGYSLTAANKRLLIVQTNLKQYQLSVSQSLELLNFLSNKFTNADLYSWLTGQLSSLYFKAYQLGLAALHRLQTAYAYELDDNTTFIPSNSWNSLRKGLLAGETLKLALARMKDAYLTKNVRRQELERIISLKLLTAESWSQLPQSGSLDFNIVVANLTTNNDTRLLKVHSVTVSIPAVIGPYEVFNGMLKNNGTNEQISISRGIDDMGIFFEDRNDGRYLPFEGMKVPKSADGDDGANARWSLAIPDQKVYANISDVILTIRFTAK